MCNYSVKKRLVIKLAVTALKDKNVFPASNLSLFSKAIFPKTSFGRLTALLLSIAVLLSAEY